MCEEIQNYIREYTREIKLKEILIKNFIPNTDVSTVAANATWNEEIEEYILKKGDSKKMQFAKRPVSALGLKRAISEQARMLKTFGVQNPRHSSDNILQLDLFLSEATTEEFNGLASQKVQNTINVVLGTDEEVNIFNPDETKLNISIDFKKFDSMGILKKMKLDKINRPASSAGRKKKDKPKK